MATEQVANPVAEGSGPAVMEVEQRTGQRRNGPNSHHVNDSMHAFQRHLLHSSEYLIDKWTGNQKRLAGTRVMPQFHDKLRAVSQIEGDMDIDEAGRHAHLYGKFFLATLLVCVVCFGFPLRSACGLETELSNKYLEEHWRFFVFSFPGVLVMMGSFPAFAVVLAINLSPEGDEDESVILAETARQARHNHEHPRALGARVWAKLGPSLVLTVFPSLVCIFATMFLAENYFGFPVPYSALLAGFPAYFTIFPLTMMYLGFMGYKGKIFLEMLKLFVLMTLQLSMIVIYPTLAALAKRNPDWEVAWAIVFPMVSKFTKFVLMALFRKEWIASPGLAAPILANHDIISSCMPACLLPSAVSFRTYMIVAAVDALMQLWDLRYVAGWLPVLKLLLGITKPQEADESLRVLRKEISAAHVSQISLAEDSNSSNDPSKAAESFDDEVGPGPSLTPQQKRNAAAKAHMAKHRGEHTAVRQAIQDAMNLESNISDAELQAFRDKLGTVASVEEALETKKALLLFGHEHVLEREYEIVVTLVSEFYESLVPILVLALEFFLRFGWNRDCVPSVSEMPTDEFFSSAWAKICYIAVQLLSTTLSAFIISECTELQSLPVLSYVLNHHFEVLIIGMASGLVFSYTVSIPHYNFNVDIFVDEGVTGGFQALADAVGGIEPLPVSGCFNDVLGSGVG
jgi:hypothetical protein